MYEPTASSVFLRVLAWRRVCELSDLLTLLKPGVNILQVPRLMSLAICLSHAKWYYRDLDLATPNDTP